jgi:hypothetical protein
MAWDKAKPAGSDKIRLSDDMIRDNWEATEDFSAEDHVGLADVGTPGQHTVLNLVDQAGDAAAPGAGYVRLWNNADDLKIRINGGAARFLDAIPSGEIIVFDKDTVVVGYTLQTDIDDALLFISKGSGAGGEAGGGAHSTGTWTQPNHNHTITHTHSMQGHTHSVGAHAHSMQAHTHTIATHQHTIAHTHNLGRTGDANGNFAGTKIGSNAVGGQLSLYSSGGSAQAVADLTTASSAAASGFSGALTSGAPSTANTSTQGAVDTGAPSSANTGASSAANTGNEATANTWRPNARVFTRQERL